MEDFIANLPLGVKGLIALAVLVWTLATPEFGRWFLPRGVSFFTEVFPGVFIGHCGECEEEEK